MEPSQPNQQQIPTPSKNTNTSYLSLGACLPEYNSIPISSGYPETDPRPVTVPETLPGARHNADYFTTLDKYSRPTRHQYTNVNNDYKWEKRYITGKEILSSSFPLKYTLNRPFTTANEEVLDITQHIVKEEPVKINPVLYENCSRENVSECENSESHVEYKCTCVEKYGIVPHPENYFRSRMFFGTELSYKPYSTNTKFGPPLVDCSLYETNKSNMDEKGGYKSNKKWYSHNRSYSTASYATAGQKNWSNYFKEKQRFPSDFHLYDDEKIVNVTSPSSRVKHMIDMLKAGEKPRVRNMLVEVQEIENSVEVEKVVRIRGEYKPTYTSYHGKTKYAKYNPKFNSNGSELYNHGQLRSKYETLSKRNSSLVR